MRDRTPLAVLTLALAVPAQVPDTVKPLHERLQLEPVRLEGIVVDALQRPVPLANVVVRVAGDVLIRTQTDAEGVFSASGLPQAVVHVRATTTTPDVGGTWVDLLGLERGFARVGMMPARKISGTVRTRNGDPVPGAWIEVSARDSAEFALTSSEVYADARGAFVLPHAPMGQVRLRAWAPGHDAGEIFLTGSEDVARDVLLYADAIEVQTFHLLDASPQQCRSARLQVRATSAGLPSTLPPPLRHPQFNDNGVATVRGWFRDDVLTANVSVDDALAAPPAHHTRPGSSDAHWRFRLGDETQWLRGRLTSATAAIANRVVLAQPLQNNGTGDRVLARTANDGTFALASPVDRGEQFALRICDGGATVDGSREPCWLVAEHGSRLHEITIAPASNIKLRAQDADGNAAPGAWVLVFAGLHNARQDRQLQEPLHATGPMLGLGITGLDGHVEIRGLDIANGERVACVVLGSNGWNEAVALVPPNLRVDLGPISLVPGAELVGRVNEGIEGDQGAAGGRMQITSPLGSQFVHWHHNLAAGRDGRFRIGCLIPGNYAFRSMDVGRSWTMRLVAGQNAFGK